VDLICDFLCDSVQVSWALEDAVLAYFLVDIRWKFGSNLHFRPLPTHLEQGSGAVFRASHASLYCRHTTHDLTRPVNRLMAGVLMLEARCPSYAGTIQLLDLAGRMFWELLDRLCYLREHQWTRA
jgi:hypothetical protein